MSTVGEKTIVISNGTLIDGNGAAPTRNEAIVIQGNRIKSTGRLPAEIKLEDRDHVEVINAAGQWIMPGLIDAHTHLS
jgi:cytosine/adenosine deaminase-related metal-dependent hydrolase